MNSKKTTPEFWIYVSVGPDRYVYQVFNRMNVLVAMFDNESDAEAFCIMNNGA